MRSPEILAANELKLMVDATTPLLVWSVAKLGIPDLLAERGLTAEELGAKLSVHAPALARVLRAVTALGIFAEENGVYTLTPLGNALRQNAPGAANATVLWAGFLWTFQGQLLETLRTGQPAFEKVYGKSFFSYLENNPDTAKVFNDMMTGVHGDEVEAIVAAYDFGSAQKIIDVGGGSGKLLAAILGRNPGTRGTLFDRPLAVADGRVRMQQLGLSSRCDFVDGNFFESVPAGGDVYILSHILHDWDETNIRKVLSNIRAGMTPSSRLLVVEMIVPPDSDLHTSKFVDIAMLLIFPGARERTEAEYQELFTSAGFRYERTVETASASSVMELRLA